MSDKRVGLFLCAAAALLLAVAAYPGALVVVPFGNDGVGVPGPFIAAVPDNMRLLLFRPGQALNVRRERQVVLATIGPDDSRPAARRADAARLAAGPLFYRGNADAVNRGF
jgi:hypothetical protein